MVSAKLPALGFFESPRPPEVEQRPGEPPSWRRLAPGAPEISSSFGGFARAAYLDNTLPSLFKEQLVVHLASLCEDGYRITRQIGTLLGLGHIAGDPETPATSGFIVLPSSRGLLRGAELAEWIAVCEERAAPLTEMPDVDTPLGAALFACAGHVFLETPEASRCLEALQRALCDRVFHPLMALLAFTRIAHEWPRLRPGKVLEDHIAGLRAPLDRLADRLLDSAPASRIEAVFGCRPDERAPPIADERQGDEIQQARLLVREAEERCPFQAHVFDTVLSSITDFACIFDRGYRIVFANKPLLHAWGVTAEQAKGKRLLELGYPGELAARLETQIEQVYATKKGLSDELCHAIPVGDPGHYEYLLCPVVSREGTVESVVGSARNVSERKRSDELRKAQNRALELVATGTPLPDVLNCLARIVEAQSGAHSVVAIMLLEDGRHLRRGAAPSLPDELKVALDGGEISPHGPTCAKAAAMRSVVITPDIAADPGWSALAHVTLQHGYHACWTTPIVGSNGRVLGTFGTLFRERRGPTDRERGMVEGLCRAAALAIERQRAEQEREHLLERERAARAEAELAGRMKDEFLATLSHELRTPLTAILGWAETLNFDGNERKDLARGLRAIERNARAQARIIEDLLDMSRIISGKVRLDVQRVDIGSVVEATIETVKPAATAKGVRIHSVLDSPVPAVSGDPDRIQQVLWNLLSNAIKFTPSNGRVEVTLKRVGSHVEVTVSDSGEGITPQFLPHVFDRFRQADASITRNHGGLGLGLAIVKQLVELHGGTVSVESRGPGTGSTFTVSLPPLTDEPAASNPDVPRPDTAAERRDAPADLRAELAGVKVLVVDDEPDAREVIQHLLESNNVTVITAASAAEALERVRAERPDVLVSDIGMPGEDGYALIRRVRALGRDQGGGLPSMALTAYARAEDRDRARLSGFEAHLTKPVDPHELTAAIARLVRSAQER